MGSARRSVGHIEADLLTYIFGGEFWSVDEKELRYVCTLRRACLGSRPLLVAGQRPC